MQQRLRMAFVAGVSALAAASAGAQMRVTNPIPASMMPPAGLCRVWLAGVAPARQPAPTDCATARAHAPAGSRIVYGTRSSVLRTGEQGGRVDPRHDPRYDPRTGRSGDWDRDGRGRDWEGLSDKERRKREKERVKAQREREREREKWQRERERERAKAEREREKEQRKREKERAKRARDRDDDRWEGRDRDRDGRYDPRTRTGTWPGRAGGTVPCVDVNRDGICDTRP